MQKKHRYVLLALHVAVLLGAVALLALISVDTFRGISFVDNQRYLHAQLWICLLFLADAVAEFALSPRRGRWLVMHAAFILVAIPWLNILMASGVHLSGRAMYVLRFIPMVRAAYVTAIVAGALAGGRGGTVQSMFVAYLALLFTIVYMSSMMFYVEEHAVNTAVTSYGQALWWAIMCMTTAGSYIGEVTTTGKVLAVVLSGGGLILFPVFTVYITHAVAGTPTDDAVAVGVVGGGGGDGDSTARTEPTDGDSATAQDPTTSGSQSA